MTPCLGYVGHVWIGMMFLFYPSKSPRKLEFLKTLKITAQTRLNTFCNPNREKMTQTPKNVICWLSKISSLISSRNGSNQFLSQLLFYNSLPFNTAFLLSSVFGSDCFLTLIRYRGEGRVCFLSPPPLLSDQICKIVRPIFPKKGRRRRKILRSLFSKNWRF